MVYPDHGLYVHVPDPVNDIFCKIIEIRQQITWIPKAALYSYKHSLTQCPGNSIQTATNQNTQVSRDVSIPVHKLS